MINIEIMETGRATVTLQRPEMHNAFDEALIAALHDAFTQLGENDDVRCIVLAAEGRSFSAGADLNWMKRMSTYTHEQNLGDATRHRDMPEAHYRSGSRTMLRRRGRLGSDVRYGDCVRRGGVFIIRGQAGVDPGDHRALCRRWQGGAHGTPLFPF